MSLIIVCKIVCLPFCQLNILCNVYMSVQGVFICHAYMLCHSYILCLICVKKKKKKKKSPITQLWHLIGSCN